MLSKVLLETKGHEQFEDAYGDEMSRYAELQKDIAGKLDLNISADITEDVLPRFYQSVQKKYGAYNGLEWRKS